MDAITPGQFEELCLQLGEKDGDVIDTSPYGVPGQGQQGIDIYIRRQADRVRTIQARRIRELTPGGIHGAVDDFLDGDWAERSESFVLATSAEGRRTELVDERDRQAQRLHDEGIEFELWDRDGISRRLKSHPDLVDDFFGPGWVEAFNPRVTPATEEAGRYTQAATAGAPARVIVLDSGTDEAVQKAVKRLQEQVPEEVPLVEGLLSGSNKAERAAALIDDPSGSIESASWHTWVVLARIAERGGDWAAGSRAWEQVSRLRDGNVRDLANAAIASHVGGDPERAEAMLQRAEELEPEHPKVLMERVNQMQDPREQLATLEGVESDDRQENALLACHRALAYLQLDQVDEATGELATAAQLGPDMVQVRMVDTNIKVHRGRLARIEGAPINHPELREAERAAVRLREELLPQRRYVETARALMLASDAAALRDDSSAVDAILEMPLEEELEFGDEASTLALAALRARKWNRAQELTDYLEEGPEKAHIRASADLALGQNTAEALQNLENLVAAGGREARAAALAILTQAAFRNGEWTESAEVALQAEDEDFVLILKAFRLSDSGDYPAAKKLLSTHLDRRKFLEAAFDLAVRHREEDSAELALQVLATNPDHSVRMDCAAALFNNGDHQRAEAETRSVAEDATAGTEDRSNGYYLLVKALGAQDRWEAASQEIEFWARVRPNDDRIGLMQAQVGNRLRRQGRHS
jgi:hypothetical protein